MTPFDASKPVHTRDGRKARIVAADMLGGKWPILALVMSACGKMETTHAYTHVGISSTGFPPLDLLNIDEFAKPGRDIVLTRSGRRVWILTREGPDPEAPIIGIVEGDVQPDEAWGPDGAYYSDGRRDNWDLML